ncbi:TPA: type IV conjugative transfer system lipoprotein TraV [Escherichia coli]|nr:type IV conjugative transfer system lipoprotein TraV [Escherichia coli]
MKTRKIVVAMMTVLLSGCAGMNSEFEFDKPAKDSGIWMAEADDMTVSKVSANGDRNNHISLEGYRLLNTGNIRLDVQPAMTPGYSGSVPGYPISVTPSRSGTVFKHSASYTISGFARNSGVNCNAPRCYPEPSSAFRTPDNLVRVWIAPYVSPDDNAHMGEIVYSVAKKAEWNGIM